MWQRQLIYRGQKNRISAYKNPDNDLAGTMEGGATFRPEITTVSGALSNHLPIWSSHIRDRHRECTGVMSQDRSKSLRARGRIWWGKDGNNVPPLSGFLTDVHGRCCSGDHLDLARGGSQSGGKKEHLKRLTPNEAEFFITPKPEGLIERIFDDRDLPRRNGPRLLRGLRHHWRRGPQDGPALDHGGAG